MWEEKAGRGVRAAGRQHVCCKALPHMHMWQVARTVLSCREGAGDEGLGEGKRAYPRLGQRGREGLSCPPACLPVAVAVAVAAAAAATG